MNQTMMPLIVVGMVVVFFPMRYISRVAYEKWTNRAMSEAQGTDLGLICVVIVVIGGVAATLTVGG